MCYSNWCKQARNNEDVFCRFCLISHTYFSSGISTEALSLEGPLLGTSANEYHMLSSRTLSGRLLFLFVKSLSWCNELILTFSVCQKKNFYRLTAPLGKFWLLYLLHFFMESTRESRWMVLFPPQFFFSLKTHTGYTSSFWSGHRASS